MYETRAYDNEHGDPVVVLVATGTHDVSRLVNLLKSGNCEQVGLASSVLRQVRRHNGGRAALQLLAAHDGPDFLFEDRPTVEITPAVIKAFIDAPDEDDEDILGPLRAAFRAAGLTVAGGERRA
jgi:hypothetical protein